MTIDKLFEFYKTCLAAGFCKVIQNTDKTNDNVIALYAPKKENKKLKEIEESLKQVSKRTGKQLSLTKRPGKLQYFLFDENSTDLYSKIKNNCWISIWLSSKNIKKITKYREKLAEFNKDIEYFVKLTKKHAIITSTIDGETYKKKLKLKLFTFNHDEKSKEK